MEILAFVAGLTGLSMTGVLPEKVKGLLVDRRLSTPAGQPGVQLVIVTGQQMHIPLPRPGIGRPVWATGHKGSAVKIAG